MAISSPGGANKETRREVRIIIFTAKEVSGGLFTRRNQNRHFALLIRGSFDEHFTIFATKRTQKFEFSILLSI